MSSDASGSVEAPERKRNRSEVASSNDNTPPRPTSTTNDASCTPQLAPMEDTASVIETSASTLELIGHTFAGVQRSVVDALKHENEHAVATIRGVVADASDMAHVAAGTAHKLLAKSDQLLRVTAESESLKGALACREEEIRSGLSTIARLATESATAVSVARGASASAAAEIAVLRHQCDTLTKTLQNSCEAHREKEAALAARIAQLESNKAQSQLTTARLQCGLRWANEKASGQREETVRMVQVMQQLCNIKKTEEGSALDLAQSRSQVKRLERYLQLNDIVAAMVPPDAALRQQTHGASHPHALGEAAPIRPSMPPSSVKEVAPNFFALRVLEHKDVSIAEMVDHWAAQTERIEALTTQLREQTSSFDKLQRDASRTHALYAEERRRREAEERRVAELQRQRLVATGSSHAAAAELDALRLQSSTLLDTNAILTVQLRHNRDDRASLDRELTAAKATIAQLEQAGKGDAVVQAIAALKVHYERETSRLQSLYVEATVEGERKSAQVVQLQQLLHHETATTSQVRAAYASVVSALKRSEQLVAQLQRSANDAWQQSNAKDHATAASLLGLAQRERSDLRSPPNRTHRPADTVFEVLSKILNSLDTIERIASQPRSDDAADAASRGPEQTTNTAAVVSELRQSLRAAMNYTIVQMESTQQIRNYFVDAQVADASCTHALYQTLKRTVEERDAAQSQLAHCQAFVEKHGLEAVEAVLMHEVDRSANISVAAPSPKALNGGAGRGAAAMMEEEEVLLLRAKVVEHDAHTTQLKQQLTSQKQDMCALAHDLAAARASQAAARRETEIWKGILDKEREVIAALTEAWVFARHCNAPRATPPPPEACDEEERGGLLTAESDSTSTEAVATEIDREEIDVDPREDEDDGTAAANEDSDPTARAADDSDQLGDAEYLPAAATSSPPSTDVIAYDAAAANSAPGAYSLASLLENITKTLQDVRDRTMAIGAAANAASAASEGNNGALVESTSNEADATRTFEVAVAERVERNGIGAIATLLREIYETSGVIQRQRTALAGSDAAQAAATSGLVLDTLQRRCTALEELERKRSAELQAAVQRHATDVKTMQDQLTAKHLADLEKRDADIRDRETALAGATQRAAQLDAEVQRQQQEIAKSAQMNAQLLGFVKQLQARLQQANAAGTAAPPSASPQPAPAVVAQPAAAPSPPLPPTPAQPEQQQQQ